MAEKRLLLIDGNSVLFKAFYALYRSIDHFTNATGLHTNAIYGFNVMLQKMLDRVHPTAILAAFDAGSVTFRTKMYADYKGNRKQTPPELSEQFPVMMKLLKARGIKSYELKNYEADDIIGTLAYQADAAGYRTWIVTGDRDLTQLCSGLTTVSISKTGVSRIEHYTPQHVREKMGITPRQIIDKKALQGDASDNYPGVTKVGPKTADKLIKKFGSVEGVYRHLSEVHGKKLKEHLTNDRDVAFLAKRLATIDRHAPLTIKLRDLTYHGDQKSALVKIYQKLGFQHFLSKMNLSFRRPVKFQVLNRANLASLVDNPGNEVEFYLGMFGANYHVAPLVGFALGIHGRWLVSKDVSLLKVPQIKAILESPKIAKDVFDAKRTYVGLHRLGIQLGKVNFDLLLASYLLNTSQNENDLGKIANLHGDYEVEPDAEVYGTGKSRHLPANDSVLFKHWARKLAAIKALKQPLFKHLAKNQQTNLYRQIEIPVAFVLARMEIAGITVDTQKLNEMESKYGERLAQIEQAIYEDAGEKFNIGSPKQLSHILFEKLQLPPLKKTKTGYSTSVHVLKRLAPDSPIVQKILKYRRIAKILSTYIEGLLKDVYSSDHKVHTRYLQTLTRTGRLSSVDPNLQNIPVRTPEGKRIRQAFVPRKPGWQIFSADYSQVELRVLASIAKDRNMQHEFKENDDIHASTARRIFGLKSNAEVTPNLRRQAKAVNFGIVYGISAFGLSRRNGISRKRAQIFIHKYFSEYPNVHKYMKDSVDQAHRLGYVETITHRRRYLPDIHSNNYHVRSFAERTAMNTPIQGSAADIIKVAMIKAEKAVRKMQATMLLQIHDELIFEAPDSEIPKLEKLIPHVMDTAVKLAVPLKVTTGHGRTWYDFLT